MCSRKFPKILGDLTSEHIFYRNHSLGAPELLSCYNDWSLSRNSSKVSDVIFLDLSKAFDSVHHERLLLKLNRYGIDGQLLLRFRNFSDFLTNRKQRVLIRGSYSEWSPVISGVPQGSILGPIITFLTYVNDIPNIIIITSTVAKLFADDTKIYRQINNAEDSITQQSDLWGTAGRYNLIIANVKSCESLIIRTKAPHSTESRVLC